MKKLDGNVIVIYLFFYEFRFSSKKCYKRNQLKEYPQPNVCRIPSSKNANKNIHQHHWDHHQIIGNNFSKWDARIKLLIFRVINLNLAPKTKKLRRDHLLLKIVHIKALKLETSKKFFRNLIQLNLIILI